MNPEITNLLSGLANKFGTTVEYLWPLLLKHEVATSILSLTCCCVIGLVIAIASAFLFRWGWRTEEESGLFFGSIGLFVGMLILALGLSEISDIVVPEAAVIKSIVNK